MTRVRGGRRRASLGAILAIAFASALAVAPAASADPAALVNPLNGTVGPGFPMVSASVPFGMIEPGPDTALTGGQQDPVNYDGYAYQDSWIRGFSLTHFDGAGIPIAGELPFMPTTGAVTSTDPAANASPYEHGTEIARPGYYAVTLARYGTRVELTSTTRAAVMRFTFPPTTHANVLAEVSRSIGGEHPATVSVVGTRELQGWVRSDVGSKLYFTAVFDRPFTAHGTWSGSSLAPASGQGAGSPAGAYATFDATRQRTVTMRVAISYVDMAGSARNLAAELPSGRTFDQARRAAVAAWNSRLGAVAIGGGGLSERRTFYDNLYRTQLMPSTFDDADGRYLGFDGSVHRVTAGHHHYTALSLWDTYRTEMPLLDLIDPSVAHDVLVSLLDDADQNHGVIPRWVQANVDRGIMAGDSGSAALADGAVGGLLGRSAARRALGELTRQATTLPPVWPREHLDTDLRYGYVPNDVDGIGTSLTLEYAIDDSAVSQLARALGDPADAAALESRGRFWRNLVEPQSRFIRPRNSDGSWANPTQVSDPTGITGLTAPIALPYNPALQDGYQEGTGWQYLWSVPHDVSGLAGAIGGRDVALQRLDQFFSTALNEPLLPAVPLAQQYTSFFGIYYIGNQYTSVNEPDLWTPWYYDWLGEPWKAQKVTRAEMAAYNPRPDGLPGNDDTGELSAWYVLAALGLYHVAPGVDAWELSSPAFPLATIREGTRRLRIEAPGAARARPYVHSAWLDGAPLDRAFLTTCELRTGGQLAFALGMTADPRWGAGPTAAPPSVSSPSAVVDSCARQLSVSGP